MRVGLVAAGALALAIAVVALVISFGSSILSDRSANGDTGPATVAVPSVEPGGESAVMSLHDTPRPLPKIRFQDGDGGSLTLADFRGKVVLLNIWATWCGPCRREMPTLDRLQATLGGPDFEVVALSIDRAGVGVVIEFYAEVGVEHLAKYIDESGKAARQLSAVGLPTTLLIDREGREIGRHVGPAEWDTPEMVAFIRQHLSQESGALRHHPTSRWAAGSADDLTASTTIVRPPRPTGLDLPVTGDTASSAANEGTPL
jgi:thiol-disulfide isomerase/thioredoxin